MATAEAIGILAQGKKKRPKQFAPGEGGHMTPQTYPNWKENVQGKPGVNALIDELSRYNPPSGRSPQSYTDPDMQITPEQKTNQLAMPSKEQMDQQYIQHMKEQGATPEQIQQYINQSGRSPQGANMNGALSSGAMDPYQQYIQIMQAGGPKTPEEQALVKQYSGQDGRAPQSGASDAMGMMAQNPPYNPNQPREPYGDMQQNQINDLESRKMMWEMSNQGLRDQNRSMEAPGPSGQIEQLKGQIRQMGGRFPQSTGKPKYMLPPGTGQGTGATQAAAAGSQDPYLQEQLRRMKEAETQKLMQDFSRDAVGGANALKSPQTQAAPDNTKYGKLSKKSMQELMGILRG